MNVINKSIRYTSLLLIGGIISQGLSYLVRIIMMRVLNNVEYGNFVYIWAIYTFLLVFAHFNLHSPLTQMFTGDYDIKIIQDKQPYIDASIIITFITSTISGLIISYISLRNGYSLFTSIILGICLFLHGIFINFNALGRSLGFLKNITLMLISWGVLRLIFSIYLIIKGNKNDEFYVIAYSSPIIFISLITLSTFARKYFRFKFNNEIKDSIMDLIKKSILVLISDFSTSGVTLVLYRYISNEIGIQNLITFDIVLIFLSLSALILSNFGLTLILYSKKINNPHNFIRNLYQKTFTFILIPFQALMFVLNKINFINRILLFLEINVIIEYQVTVLLIIILSFQMISINLSGLFQGRMLFRQDAFLKFASLIMVLTYISLINPTKILSLLFSFLIYFFFHSVISSIYFKLFYTQLPIN
ncbi:MAG: oligosaccharide flippase family protein [Candidatus Heimdallarchaeota archaeon]|nr:oligosaccharide flippase family protein [Candidatus Heimdallarchaeota archaeon]